ncbi:MAG: hypothetical protein AAGG00_02130 [Cyanobacteria bacterium P01_H01_bin.150]
MLRLRQCEIIISYFDSATPLIELATYIGEDNLEVSERFLFSAEETFKQLGKMPRIGKLCEFSHPSLSDV